MSNALAIPWTIVADDLTGAADATGHYGAMYSSAVVFDPESTWPSADILAVDTESRYLPEDQAAVLVSSAARRSVEADRSVFKKFDSLLRGNIGVEIAAALTELTRDERGIALVAPAFPATGRTTVGGVVHINGVPHTDGRFGGDVAHALAAGGLRVGDAIGATGQTPRQLAHRITELKDRRFEGPSLDGRSLEGRSLDAVVLDATSDDDLERIARAAELLEFPTLLAGSGGLAGHIAPARKSDHVHESLDRTIEHALVVIGSYSDLARSQLQQLIDSGVQHAQVHPGKPLAPRLRDELLHAGRDVVLTPHLALAVDKANASSVAQSLAEATSTIIHSYDVLVLTGGETARAVMDALGVDHMTVLGELEPGIVLSRLPGDMPLLVTKAGAFGDAGALVRTVTSMKSIHPKTLNPKTLNPKTPNPKTPSPKTTSPETTTLKASTTS